MGFSYREEKALIAVRSKIPIKYITQHINVITITQYINLKQKLCNKFNKKSYVALSYKNKQAHIARALYSALHTYVTCEW